MRAKALVAASVALVVAGLSAVVVWMVGHRGEPVVAGGKPTMRLITTEQYANTVRYLFGEDIDLSSARFPLLPRREGLVALGATAATMTPSTLEMFHRAARSI